MINKSFNRQTVVSSDEEIESKMHKDNFSTELLRFTFVSELGGANATLDIDLMLGN